MKLVFLDIDGVVNSSRSVIAKIGPTIETSEKVRDLARLDWDDFHNGLSPDQQSSNEEGLDYGVRFGLQTVDPVCVALINKLFEQKDVGLVLSSSHRKFLYSNKVPYGSDEHLHRLRMYLDAMGFHVPKLFSVTPVRHSKRGDEIDEWLNMAWENGIIDDEHPYVILDDAADMLPGQPLVRTDPDHGFSFYDYVEACRHLGLKEPGLVLL